MHDGTHIGETCPECETHHRVVESIPSRPFTRPLIDDLRENSSFTFVQGTNWRSGQSLGLSTDEEVTENLIIGTQTKAMHLRLYDPGWVVELEEEPYQHEDETVGDVAQAMLMHVTQDRRAALFELIEVICSILDPTYDCPECDYHTTGGTTLAREFLSHLTEAHDYTGEEAISVLEDCAHDTELPISQS
jgi:hypothetical protein